MYLHGAHWTDSDDACHSFPDSFIGGVRGQLISFIGEGDHSLEEERELPLRNQPICHRPLPPTPCGRLPAAAAAAATLFAGGGGALVGFVLLVPHRQTRRGDISAAVIADVSIAFDHHRVCSAHAAQNHPVLVKDRLRWPELCGALRETKTPPHALSPFSAGRFHRVCPEPVWVKLVVLLSDPRNAPTKQQTVFSY